MLKDALAYVRKNSAPFALVIKKGTFKPFTVPRVEKTSFQLSREEAIQQVIDILEENVVVVSTTGMPSGIS